MYTYSLVRDVGALARRKLFTFYLLYTTSTDPPARIFSAPPIDYGMVPSSSLNPVAELECVTLPWRLLQEA